MFIHQKCFTTAQDNHCGYKKTTSNSVLFKVFILLFNVMVSSTTNAQQPGIDNFVWQSSSNDATGQSITPFNPISTYGGLIRYFVPGAAQVTVRIATSPVQLDITPLISQAGSAWSNELAAQGVSMRIGSGSATAHNVDMQLIDRSTAVGQLMFPSPTMMAVTYTPGSSALSAINTRLSQRGLAPITGGIYFASELSLSSGAWNRLTESLRNDLSQEEKLKLIYYATIMHEVGHLLGHDHPLIAGLSRMRIELDDNAYNSTGRRFVYRIPEENRSSAPLMDSLLSDYFENRARTLGRPVESTNDIVPAPTEVIAINTICLPSSGSTFIARHSRHWSKTCPAFSLDKILPSDAGRGLNAALYKILF
jgi:hypothetical protein